MGAHWTRRPPAREGGSHAEMLVGLNCERAKRRSTRSVITKNVWSLQKSSRSYRKRVSGNHLKCWNCVRMTLTNVEIRIWASDCCSSAAPDVGRFVVIPRGACRQRRSDCCSGQVADRPSGTVLENLAGRYNYVRGRL